MTARISRLFRVILVSALCVLTSCKNRPRVAAAFEFDAAGRLLSAKGPDGKKVVFQYDTHGLPIEITSSDGSAKYAYDAHRNRIWVHDDAGSTEYYYDAFDRLAGVIWDRGPRRLLAYEYDHVGLPSRISVFNLQPVASDPKFATQLASLEEATQSDAANWHERELKVLSLSDQLRQASAGNPPWLANDISYVRNLQGDLEEIRSAAGVIKFDRSADGSRVERILPNGVHSTFKYTPGGRLSQLRHTDSSGREIASFSYKYDRGHLDSVFSAERGRSTETGYVWDDLGRLRTMTVGGTEFLYKYDDQARRLTVTSGGKTVTYFFDGLGRILRAQGISMRMIPEGTMSARRDESETTDIRYNTQGRPVEMATRSGTFHYTWDGEGNLVAIAENGKTVHFVPAAGTGVRLPFVESGEDGGSESRQVVGQTILGSTGSNAPQFYLEGAAGDIGYTVNDHGMLIGDPQNSAGFVRLPRYIPAQFAMQSPRTRLGTQNAGPSLLPVQLDTSQQRQPADAGWDQQWAQAQGWTQGLWQSSIAWRWDSRHDMALLNADMESNWYQGNVFQRTLGFEEALAAWWQPVMLADQKLGEAGGAYLVVQNGQNLSAFESTAKDAGVQSLLMSPLLNKAFEGLVTQPMTNALTAYAGSVLKNVEPTLKPLLTGAEFQGLKTAYSAPAINDMVKNSWGPIETFGDTINQAHEASLALEKAGPNALCGASCNTTSSALKGNPLGGIQLSSTVQGDIGKIFGAVYDSTSGSVVLLTDNNAAAVAGLKAEDFAVALRLAYSESPEEAAFSLDPADPKNPDGPWLQKIYYPDRVLAGTDFGKALFSADWLLKQYSFGVVVEPGKPQTMRASAVPGYKSVSELSLNTDHEANHSAVRSRFWIVAGEMKIRRDGNAIVFDKASMGVKTKRQLLNPNSKTGLSDDNTLKDPVHEEFARRFTEHYDELAAESPELERVRELAKAVAIAKWLRQNNVPVDSVAINQQEVSLQSEDPDAHRLVPALSTTFQKVSRRAIREHNQEGIETSTTELHLFGGVDLKSSPEIRTDSKVGELRQLVQAKLTQPDTPRFEVSFEGKTLKGTVLPLTHEALVQRINARTLVRNGNVYRLDSEGRLAGMVDKAGDRAKYRDPAMGKAGGIEIDGAAGWHAVEQQVKDGLSLNLTTARGNRVDVLSDLSGAVETIAVDGISWAEAHKQLSGSSVRLDHRNYAEVITFDPAGRTTGYRIERPIGPGKADVASAKLEYNAVGQPVRLSGTGIPATELKYDQGGRLQSISSSNGRRITVAHEKSAERAILEERIDPGSSGFRDHAVASLTFEDGHVIRSEAPEFGRLDQKYENGKLISTSSESGITNYSYNKSGHISEISFPSGAEIRIDHTQNQNQDPSQSSTYLVRVFEPQSGQRNLVPRGLPPSQGKIRTQA